MESVVADSNQVAFRPPLLVESFDIAADDVDEEQVEYTRLDTPPFPSCAKFTLGNGEIQSPSEISTELERLNLSSVEEFSDRDISISAAQSLLEAAKDTMGVEEIRHLLVENDVNSNVSSQIIYNLKARDTLITQLIYHFSDLINAAEQNDKASDADSSLSNGENLASELWCDEKLDDETPAEKTDTELLKGDGIPSIQLKCADLDPSTPESLPKEKAPVPMNLKLNLPTNNPSGNNNYQYNRSPRDTGHLAGMIKEQTKQLRSLRSATMAIANTINRDSQNTTNVPTPVLLAELGRCRESYEAVVRRLMDAIHILGPNHRYQYYKRHDHGGKPLLSHRGGASTERYSGSNSQKSGQYGNNFAKYGTPRPYRPRNMHSQYHRQDNSFNNNPNNHYQYNQKPRHHRYRRGNEFQQYRNFLAQVQNAPHLRGHFQNAAPNQGKQNMGRMLNTPRMQSGPHMPYTPRMQKTPRIQNTPRNHNNSGGQKTPRVQNTPRVQKTPRTLNIPPLLNDPAIQKLELSKNCPDLSEESWPSLEQSLTERRPRETGC